MAKKSILPKVLVDMKTTADRQVCAHVYVYVYVYVYLYAYVYVCVRVCKRVLVCTCVLVPKRASCRNKTKSGALPLNSITRAFNPVRRALYSEVTAIRSGFFFFGEYDLRHAPALKSACTRV